MSIIYPAPVYACCWCFIAELAAGKGKLALFGVSEDIRTVMSHTGFLSFFTLADSEAAAIQAVS